MMDVIHFHWHSPFLKNAISSGNGKCWSCTGHFMGIEPSNMEIFNDLYGSFSHQRWGWRHFTDARNSKHWQVECLTPKHYGKQVDCMETCMETMVSGGLLNSSNLRECDKSNAFPKDHQSPGTATKRCLCCVTERWQPWVVSKSWVTIPKVALSLRLVNYVELYPIVGCISHYLPIWFPDCWLCHIPIVVG